MLNNDRQTRRSSRNLEGGASRTVEDGLELPRTIAGVSQTRRNGSASSFTRDGPLPVVVCQGDRSDKSSSVPSCLPASIVASLAEPLAAGSRSRRAGGGGKEQKRAYPTYRRGSVPSNASSEPSWLPTHAAKKSASTHRNPVQYHKRNVRPADLEAYRLDSQCCTVNLVKAPMALHPTPLHSTKFRWHSPENEFEGQADGHTCEGWCHNDPSNR